MIVHLQRLAFNFDTFRNEKINTYFEFPNQLDLKPYSYYGVMEQENRLDNKKAEEEEEEEPKKEEEDNKEEEEENPIPEVEDCYEYKLVGVNVHSGTANAGHYWSYINIKRGAEDDENDPQWPLTEKDAWMEFNDSRVSDFNFSKIKDDCFGNDGNKSQSDEFSFGFGNSTSYGKSAYMLVYERKEKKPLKVLVPDEEKGQDGVHFDEAKDETYRMVPYKSFEHLQPNNIYKEVLEDNKKFEFDNDIYSYEFFNFI